MNDKKIELIKKYVKEYENLFKISPPTNMTSAELFMAVSDEHYKRSIAKRIKD